MSEYEYYEFLAIDRPLTAEQQAAVRGRSRRAQVSAGRASFDYSYGGSPGDAMKLLEQHFDAMLYITNWGEKQLAFRLPKGAADLAQLQRYAIDAEDSGALTVRATAKHLLVSFHISDQEGDGWIEGEGVLDSLAPLREALLRGDVRWLYLAWLCLAARRADLSDDDDDAGPLTEPPVPPGLGQLDPALQAMAELFEIDEDLAAAAAEASPPLGAAKEPIARWVALLPAAERDAFLVRVAQGEAQVGAELLRRLREVGGAHAPAAAAPGRAFAELQAAARRHAQLRARRKREEAEQARLAHLADLARREQQIWALVPALLEKRTGQGYNQGVELLADLRDLAEHRGSRAEFDARLGELLAPYAASPALLRRLKEKRIVA